MNNQKPEKREKSTGDELLVHSIFHTIQGEGPFTGVPAVFVRLAGCNLQCPGCDTEYTKGSIRLSIAGIAHTISTLIAQSKTRLVVISGGEPFRQNISKLVNMLHASDLTAQVETNGSMAPQGDFDSYPVIICSPKTSKLNPKMLPLITAYKYVVDHQKVHTDGLPLTALGHVATPMLARPPSNFDGDIYLQPMDMSEIYPKKGWVKKEFHDRANLAFVVESCMKHGYTIQLQIHKILDLE